MCMSNSSVSKSYLMFCLAFEKQCEVVIIPVCSRISMHDITRIPMAFDALECRMMCVAYSTLHWTAIIMHWSDGDEILVHTGHWITHVFLG